MLLYIVCGLTINSLRISGRIFCFSAVFHVFFVYALHFIFFSEIVNCLYYAYTVAYCCTLSTNKIIIIIIIIVTSFICMCYFHTYICKNRPDICHLCGFVCLVHQVYWSSSLPICILANYIGNSTMVPTHQMPSRMKWVCFILFFVNMNWNKIHYYLVLYVEKLVKSAVLI